jgi:periplasmic divalent cation tolerance protein
MRNNVSSIKTTLPISWGEHEVIALGKKLLESGAACVQHHQITSTYKWKDDVKSESEWSIEIKVSHQNQRSIIDLLQIIHPYEVPQIICSAATANDAYSEWVNSQ